MTSLTRNCRFSEVIDNAARAPHKELKRSVLGHYEAYQELAQVWDECREQGWDGYNAPAVEQDTLRFAYQVLESLPIGFPRPTIGAQSSGQLTFEWHRHSTRTLTVSIDCTGEVFYAALFGTEEHCGKGTFNGELPVNILRLAGEV